MSYPIGIAVGLVIGQGASWDTVITLGGTVVLLAIATTVLLWRWG